jgi:phosphatidylglycerol:prolipoprotein diacylglycerol transferase
LAVTYWFEPTPLLAATPVTIRFRGRRIGTLRLKQPGDVFVQDETIERVIPGSGPIALTTRIHGINSGQWAVTASILEPLEAARGATANRAPTQRNLATAQPDARFAPQLARFWRNWPPIADSTECDATPIDTCLAPFVHTPGLLPTGSWGAFVGLGIVVALLTQALLLARLRVAVGSVWLISLAAIVAGIISAKFWYRIQYRARKRWDGWCIQGFIVGVGVMAILLLVLFSVPVGVALDATAPGLLFGMAIGRLGCFFAGCCGGPPTAARWGVWSSDQRIGARRVPTQLMEATLSLILGVGVLLVMLLHGPAGGGLFVAGLAAYTLGRQGILRLRAEPRKTQWGLQVTAVVAALTALGAIAVILG